MILEYTCTYITRLPPDSCGYKTCLFISIINCFHLKFKLSNLYYKNVRLKYKDEKKMNDLKRMKRKIFNKLCMLYQGSGPGYIYDIIL